MAKRKWNDKELIQAVSKSECITDVLKCLKINHVSINAKTVRKHIAKLKIDTSHWKDQVIKKPRTGYETPLKEVFIINSNFTRSHLKEKIIKYDLLPYKCSNCNLGPYWNKENLTLQVDHINGINNDNRIENLRFLCPNCHSQTITYAGSKTKGRKLVIHTCNNCGGRRTHTSKNGLCGRCSVTRDKFNWPTDSELLKMISVSNINQVSKKLGVSFTSLKKRLVKRNLFS